MTLTVEMNDYAWCWYDHQLDAWIVDCPDCGQFERLAYFLGG